MKTLKLILIGLIFSLSANIQAQVSVNVSIGSPPPWGPVGYTSVNYYYLPDVEAFYDVPSSMFIYNSGGVWVHRAHLPDRYRNYDLYNGYKVVMTDYRGNSPYSHFKEYRTKYAKGYHGPSQRTIGERPAGGNSKPAMSGKGHPNNKVKPGNNNGPGHMQNAGKRNAGGKSHGNVNGGGKGKGGGKGGKK